MKTENYQLLFESGDTYYDSAYGVDIDQDRAIQELKAHGVDLEKELQKFYDDLGDKIDIKKNQWVTSFTGRSLQNPSENGWNVKKNGGDFDQFTGATITPRAVVKQVYKVLQFVETHQKSLFTQAKLNNADKTPDAAEKANEQ